MKKKIMTIITMVMIIMVIVVKIVPAFASNKDTIFTGIDELVKKYKPQGASIALIENGEITHVKNYGYANVENKIPVNEHTAFKIASISKTMTAYGVMKLVEEGKLDLDKPITEYLTKWKLPDTQFDETKLTLRTLMSHTSGVTDSTEYGYTQALPTIDKALVQRGIQILVRCLNIQALQDWVYAS
ncbi:serine hydrolase domain-containing protein [Clostridium tagluense]|uniref:serine hydrolase domain-containing protein n=1 Tax=Clostridium tagluense TaxID=360422 RepID=UPI00209ABD71|nr:serine hydrolase domain-containing protein [Clostridium tagluense]